MKRLVVDLDHTLCVPQDGSDQAESPDHKYRIAEPIQACIDQLHLYKEQGFEIVIHTSRNMRTYKGNVDEIRQFTLPVILKWLDDHAVPYDEVVVGKPWCGTEGFYIDDRAVRPSEFASMSYEDIVALLDRERR